MREALSSEDCPLDAKLEQVLPGMHRWQQENHEAVKSLDRKIESLQETVNTFSGTLSSGFESVHSSILGIHEATKQQLASTLMSMATHLSGGRSLPTLQQFTTEDNSVFDGPNAITTLGNSLGGGSTLTTSPPPPPPTTQAPPPVKGRLLKDSTEAAAIARFGSLFTLTAKHRRLGDLWDEWHGLEGFQDEFGGIKGRDERWKSYWRMHLDDQQVSRTRRIIEGIKNYADREGIPNGDAIENLEEVYALNKFSVYKMCEWFKLNHLLDKKAARGRRKRIDDN
jgi:Transcriptional activator of glycolytic enzymes